MNATKQQLTKTQRSRLEEYLAGRCDRNQILRELGSDLLDQVEAQKQAFERDLHWALEK